MSSSGTATGGATDLQSLANEWGRGFIAELDYRAEADATIEIFAVAPNPTGAGDGKVFLASDVATGGASSTAIAFPPGYFEVTATATDTLGNTSQFSVDLP